VSNSLKMPHLYNHIMTQTLTSNTSLNSYSDIIELVRKKKEFAYLSEDFIIRHVSESLRLNVKLRDEYEQKKERAIKELVKLVRDKARKIYGVFQDIDTIQIRKEYLENITLTSKNATEKLDILLKSHLSTKERLDYYESFWEQILSLTNNPTSIIDIGCGLNPISFFIHAKPRKKIKNYTAIELSQLDADQLNAFFKHNHLDAVAYGIDAVHQIEKLPKQNFDVALLLKALDTFEHQKRYVTYEILDALLARNVKYIVATFPRATVKGFKTDRGDAIMWFEKMLPRKNLTYHRILFPTESCYICFLDTRESKAEVSKEHNNEHKHD
jgi:16S rRNA (guanine(1405)-N(7))-methyltransferase